MSLLPCPHPEPPDWQVDWPAITREFDWIRRMQGCPQDPVHHAEGDVWTHVGMVCRAMAGLDAWRALPESNRALLFAAALLHDVSKPECTRHENGRITSRGHSHRGAVRARGILWEHGANLLQREEVAALISHHQAPFYLIDRPDAQRMAYLISQAVHCDLLALLATTDALGRQCEDQVGILTRVELFREFCLEYQCLNGPSAFPSTLSRFEYFRHEGRDPGYLAHDKSSCEVILMSGLPGAGKDTWVATHAAHLPCISLDELRQQMGAAPSGHQGAVIQAAKEGARTHLRQRQGFVWNATNLSRDIRTQLVDLFTAYQARVRLVYVEAPRERLLKQNRERAKAVPLAALEHMLERWDVPGPTEAPLVEWWENTGAWTRRA
ncbi:AAA family ATPase [Paludibaculum fermentans]|uniref:AAA family ATPase n=1 Tax=Paludibaculum fermentans TaxID=1473598 RepID=UPI003EB7972C